MSDLVRRADFNLSASVVPLRRVTRSALENVRDDALIEEAKDAVAAHLTRRRINTSYDLMEETVIRAGGLSGLITAVSAGNPGLEMNLRSLEAGALVDADAINRAYRRRPL
jgi:hypothetical protein